MDYKKLSTVLRYSMNTVTNLLEQLHANPEARFPQNGATPESNPHTLQRLVTADALEDADRNHEASLLRDLDRHVMLHNGQVKGARPITLAQVRAARNQVSNTLLYPNYAHHIIGITQATNPLTYKSDLYNITHDADELKDVPVYKAGNSIADEYDKRVPEEHKTPQYKAAIHNLRNIPYEELDE